MLLLSIGDSAIPVAGWYDGAGDGDAVIVGEVFFGRAADFLTAGFGVAFLATALTAFFTDFAAFFPAFLAFAITFIGRDFFFAALFFATLFLAARLAGPRLALAAGRFFFDLLFFAMVTLLLEIVRNSQ